MSTLRCSFGELAENHCPKDAVWLGRFESAWCNEHKPIHNDVERIAPEPTDEELLFHQKGLSTHRKGEDSVQSTLRSEPDRVRAGLADTEAAA